MQYGSRLELASLLLYWLYTCYVIVIQLLLMLVSHVISTFYDLMSHYATYLLFASSIADIIWVHLFTRFVYMF